MPLRRPGPSPRSVARIAALSAALCVPACMKDKAREVAPPAALSGTVPAPTAAHPPSVVLLCIDTLRADALSAGPDGTPWMPALRAFAKDATVFSDAVASSSWTAPSVATLLTGLEPEHDGVRGARVAGVLPPAVTTLAESLKARGYATAAITGGGWVVPSRGLGQGFDTFSADFDAKGPETEIGAWARRRPADAPFFLFLHTTAAHDPYGEKDLRHAPALVPWIAARAREIARESAAAGWTLPAGAAPWLIEHLLFRPEDRAAIQGALTGEDLIHLSDLAMDWLDGDGRDTPELAALLAAAPAAYRGGLAWADRVVERTLAALDAAALPRDTVVVVVGDHGEAVGEHGTLSHGRRLYDELVRVPLVVRAPGRLPAGSVAGSCGLVDVAPTLLALAGAPASGLDGTSLLPLAAGEAGGHPVFAEEHRRVTEDGTTFVARLVSVRTEAAKAIVTFDPATHRVLSTELYDLASDPGEERALVADDPSRFGVAFCRAVAALRARVPGLPAASPCVVAAR